MLDCIILGDSIAVGVHIQRPECESYAKGGINTWQWNKTYPNVDLTAGTVIISLGSNDHKFVKTERELRAMRERVKGKKVFWILPAGNLAESGVEIEAIRILIREIAIQYGDIVLPINRVSTDKIHPTGSGYRDLAERTK